AERLEKAEIENISCLIGVQYRVAAKDVIFQHTRERPRRAGISGKSPTALPKIGHNTVKLSPADCHPAVVCWVNCDGRLIRRVTEDVAAIGINVHLEAGEQTESRDHPRPCLEPVNVRRGHVVFFQRLSRDWLVLRRLSRSGSNKSQTDS